MVEKERSLAESSDRVEIIDARTEGVAVAVRHIMGIEG